MTASGRAPGGGEGGDGVGRTARQTDGVDRVAEERAFQMPPLVLAYVGDAVWELAVREMLAVKGERRPHRLHRSAVPYVQAGGQADRLARILPVLTPREHSVLMRGRNAKSGSVPRSATVGEYRLSTGFEALLGYLHLAGDTGRLDELLATLLGSGSVAHADDGRRDGHADGSANASADGHGKEKHAKENVEGAADGP